MASVASLARGVLDLLAPPRCAACDETLAPGTSGFCEHCESLLEPADPDRSAAAVYVYGGPIVEAIHRLKYGRRSDVARALGERLAAGADLLVADIDVVIPVPLHPRRLRARGFNQSALLARPLCRACDLRLDTRSLARVRDTPPQASVVAARRPANVAGAFRARGVAGARVLLVDDVRTTGATFASAALALCEAGAVHVRTLALARVCP